MYVYIKSEPNLWTVGFYKPDGEWESESDHGSSEEATERVHYLNGGQRMKTEIVYCDNCGEYLGDRVVGQLYRFGKLILEEHKCPKEIAGERHQSHMRVR